MTTRRRLATAAAAMLGMATTGRAIAATYSKHQQICRVRDTGTFTCTVYCDVDEVAVTGGYDLGQYPSTIDLWSSTYTYDDGRPNGWTIVADMVSPPAKRAKITVDVSCKRRRRY
ncbi:MAG: hypothetical protein ACR2J8_09280 [Thermomicrobiales bacterium]